LSNWISLALKQEGNGRSFKGSAWRVVDELMGLRLEHKTGSPIIGFLIGGYYPPSVASAQHFVLRHSAGKPQCRIRKVALVLLTIPLRNILCCAAKS